MEINKCYRFFKTNFFQKKVECNVPKYLRRRVHPIPLSQFKRNNKSKDFFFVTLHTDLLNSNLRECFDNEEFCEAITTCYQHKIKVIIDTSFEWFLEKDKDEINLFLKQIKNYIDYDFLKILVNSYTVNFVDSEYRKLFVTSIAHIYHIIDFQTDFKFSFPFKKTKKYKFSTFVSGILKPFRAATITEIFYRNLDFFVTGHPITKVAMGNWINESVTELADHISEEKVSKYYLDNIDKILNLSLYFKGKQVSNEEFKNIVNDYDAIYNLCNYNYDSYLFLGFESKDVKNFITEKSFRPIVLGIPFITLPYQNTNRYGFEPYNEIFDYGYENMIIEKRIPNILDQFELLQKDKHIDLLVGDCRDKLEYNRQHMYKLGNLNLLLDKL